MLKTDALPFETELKKKRRAVCCFLERKENKEKKEKREEKKEKKEKKEKREEKKENRRENRRKRRNRPDSLVQSRLNRSCNHTYVQLQNNKR